MSKSTKVISLIGLLVVVAAFALFLVNSRSASWYPDWAPGKTDFSCGREARDAQPKVESFVSSVDGVERVDWPNADCDDANFTALRGWSQLSVEEVKNNFQAKNCVGDGNGVECSIDGTLFYVKITQDRDTSETRITGFVHD